MDTYRIRHNEEWRNSYYALFLTARTEGFDFSQIITALFQATGNVEASFSSKMLATIDPAKPIWDQYVLQNLDLELTGKTQKEKLKNAIDLQALSIFLCIKVALVTDQEISTGGLLTRRPK